MIRQVGRLGYLKASVQILRFMWDDLAIALLLCLATNNLDKQVSKSVGPELLLPTLGIAVSVFISFRNNQSYGRWWEARILWGALVNQSRNLRDSLQSLLGDGEVSKQLIKPFLQRHVLLIWTLNNELRARPHPHATKATAQLAVEARLDSPTSQDLLIQQSFAIGGLVESSHISDISRLHLMRVLDEICNDLGGLERIRNQPLPASYDAFIRLSVWVFGFLLFIRLDALYEPYGGPVGFVMMSGFIFAERIGSYIEEPFREPVLALPMNRMAAVITKDLLGPSHPFAVPPENDRATVWT